MNQLVLSLFTGAGLLDEQFRKVGFCVVSAGDIIYGQDIRDFHSVVGKFDGIIGGSPCQDFSGLKRIKTDYSNLMLEQYERVVIESQPKWWLLENVKNAPDLVIQGYSWQRININLGWYSNVSRLRHIQFGRRDGGKMLNIPHLPMKKITDHCVLASDNRPLHEIVRMQGLPDDYDLPDFTVAGKKKLVGNGVPCKIGRVLAKEVARVTDQEFNYVTPQHSKSVTNRVIKTVAQRCTCGCLRKLTGRKIYFNATCRKRAQRKRDLK